MVVLHRLRFEQHDGTWNEIELSAVANIIVTKALKPGDSSVCIWKTINYNRNDTLAAPGTHRISFKNGIRSNQFEIPENIRP
jgi:hypothetical protein